MPDSRSRILSSIRQSLASARHLPPKPDVTLPPPSQITDPTLLIRQFADELGKLNGTFVATPMAEAPALVARLLHERSATQLLAWDQSELPVPGLLDHLRAEGFTTANGQLPHGGPARANALEEVEQLKVGLTGADAALADTATLALRSGPCRPRLASLSVRTHIALFTPDQLYPSWAGWWASFSEPARAEWVRAASNLVLISGPSRTADIEMTLTVGVHGPAEVIAVLCAPSA
jgi:L-lactate dehydrogenase complex protein LldG